MVPRASTNGVEIISPMIIGGVLENDGIKFDSDLIVNSLPRHKIISDYIIQNSADTVILAKLSSRENPFVYISCNTGNMKGNKNLVKYLC